MISNRFTQDAKGPKDNTYHTGAPANGETTLPFQKTKIAIWPCSKNVRTRAMRNSGHSGIEGRRPLSDSGIHVISYDGETNERKARETQ